MRRLRRLLVASCLVGGALFCAAAAVAETPPLPNPLTLQDALALSLAERPALELAMAGRDASAAALAEAEALSGVRVGAVGRLRAIKPAHVAINRDTNDSSATLAVRKRLYDFGYSRAREEAARQAGVGSDWRYLDARQEAHLEVMRRFFNVLLADLEFARDNEAMAGAFIDADRARDRHELQRVSDVELAAVESLYQSALQLRVASQARQRASRAQLAIAMGRPEQLASNLVRPPAPDTAAQLPDYDVLVAEVLAANPTLKALRAEVEAARAEVEAAGRATGPVLSGEIDASVYNRTTNSTHPLAAGLVLEVPLLTGGQRDADLAAARARMRMRSAELAAAEQALRQEVLDLRLNLDKLRVELAGLKVRRDYRELYLDRSRALYELEVKTDLGDAMTEVTAAQLDSARAEFEWMMTQARLAALAGRLLPEDQTP